MVINFVTANSGYRTFEKQLTHMKLILTFLTILLSFSSFSQVVCDSTASEITICQGNLPYVWNNENYSSSGIYIDTLQNENACDSIIVLVLTITPTTTESTTVPLPGFKKELPSY